MSTLAEDNATYNNQLAFDILQKEFGITPIMSASAFASSKEIDQLSVVLYLTQVHNAFSETPKPAGRFLISTGMTFEDLVLQSCSKRLKGKNLISKDPSVTQTYDGVSHSPRTR